MALSPRVSPREVPAAPAICLDGQLGTLQEFLNSIAAVVNYHDQVLHRLLPRVATQVSVSDLAQVFGLSPQTDGQACFSQASEAVATMKATLQTTSYSQTVIENKLEELTQTMQHTVTSAQLETELARLRAEINSSLENNGHSFDQKLYSTESQILDRVGGVEENVVWRVKYLEKIVSDQPTQDSVTEALANLENRVSQSFQKSMEIVTRRQERALEGVKKDVQRISSEMNSSNSKISSNIRSLAADSSKKVSITDFNIVSNEQGGLRKQFRSFVDTEFAATVAANDKLSQEMKAVSTYTAALSQQMESIKQDIEESAKKLAEKLEANPPVNYISEKHLGKLKEHFTGQVKRVEKRVDRLSQTLNTSALQKAIEAVEATATARLEQLGEQSRTLESHCEFTSQETAVLKQSLEELKRLIEEKCFGQGLATSKALLPAQCLSCGKKDTTFSPMVPQTSGQDGRLYRADRPLTRGAAISESELPRSASSKKVRVPWNIAAGAPRGLFVAKRHYRTSSLNVKEFE